MLFQVESVEDSAKNVVDPPVVWIRGFQKFLDFFYVNDVSLEGKSWVCKTLASISLQDCPWTLPP